MIFVSCYLSATYKTKYFEKFLIFFNAFFKKSIIFAKSKTGNQL